MGPPITHTNGHLLLYLNKTPYEQTTPPTTDTKKLHRYAQIPLDSLWRMVDAVVPSASALSYLSTILPESLLTSCGIARLPDPPVDGASHRCRLLIAQRLCGELL